TLSNIMNISPYTNYPAFHEKIATTINEGNLPDFFVTLCEKISIDRKNSRHIHVLKNCPIDKNLPDLDLNNPVEDKRKFKKTFLGEAFLGTFAYLLNSPLFSYASRNNGDFFTDVIRINRFNGKRTGFTDGDLIYHNDRTSHPVKADYIALLGMRCPKNDLVYTDIIDGKDIIKNLSQKYIEILSQKIFYTAVDDLTRENNKDWDKSKQHAIINGEKVWFQDTLTKPITSAPAEATEAVLAFRDAMTKAPKYRHRLEKGDLLVFPNQYALHDRERIEVNHPEEASKRWLLKTYTFENPKLAEEYSKYWANGVYGCVSDGN
ncbi:MAG: taurine catabolism dioxygenase TauD, partial [Clostridiales bacterium]|nr:taurine catabolism dioxygenase TauD [Clostridiales bacterium]